ncbi:MAG: efflux transporter periplasmic adaptor subunit [Flavobacteriales bacterium CG11_big_fil_rev_8_21_14_0_20_35_7]|nr:MAG: efflux transporter periplasmic adaptor subunit [Flavobacteriales bacterium CG11_big_fil_rev_8_21_14_0_20_35_7]
MRRTLSTILALILVISAVLLANYIIGLKQKTKPIADKIVKTVFVEKIINKRIPIVITANGTLVAKHKIELYSEVQGVLERTAKDFKSGTAFNKGEILIKINNEESFANLQAQKSSLFNALTAIMPDIQLDYPTEYAKWKSYLQKFNIDKKLQKLPESKSEKETYFISGRGIFTAYYNVKNLEVKLNKFVLTAPFNGILTESLVNPGTLIRPGQKIGEFIDPNSYEMAVSVKSEFRNLLQVGKTVELFNLEKTKTWQGKVIRINGKVDTTTQTIFAYIEVNGSDLREGQYLEVALQAKSEENAVEVSRSLLVENSKVFIVKDSVLDLVPINLVFENRDNVVVKGLNNGMLLLSKSVPGAFSGMLVKISNAN